MAPNSATRERDGSAMAPSGVLRRAHSHAGRHPFATTRHAPSESPRPRHRLRTRAGQCRRRCRYRQAVGDADTCMPSAMPIYAGRRRRRHMYAAGDADIGMECLRSIAPLEADTPPCVDHLYTYGLYSCGLYGYGLGSYGVYSHGLYSCGLHSYGLYNHGVYSYGLCNCGLHSYGPRNLPQARRWARAITYYIGISASPTARPYPRDGHAVGDADICMES